MGKIKAKFTSFFVFNNNSYGGVTYDYVQYNFNNQFEIYHHSCLHIAIADLDQ